MTAGPRRTLVVIAVVVAFLIAGVVLAFRDDGGTVHKRSAQPVETAPPTPTTATTGTDITWVEFAGVQVPVSEAAGPYDMSGGRARGFAKTDLGAALAAVHIANRASYLVEPTVFRATIREQVTGDDAETLLAAVEAGYDQATEAAGAGGEMPQGNAAIHGYRVLAGDNDTRAVSILYSGPDAQAMTVWVSVRKDLVWVDEDWKIVAPFAGDTSSAATVAGPDAATSYRPFAG